MAHIHDVFNTDERFVINPSTRVITQKSGKTKLMLRDHNSERYAFEMSRYVEGHDMSLCTKITIHYINLAGNKKDKSYGPYIVEDLQIDPENENRIVFSWLVSRGCTTYPGTLNFTIEFECLTGDVVDYAWHTDIFKAITVGDGIYNDEVLLEEYHDVLEQWKNEILLHDVTDDHINSLIDDKLEAFDAGPTDEHINSLIDAKLGVIENGSY